MDKYTYTPLFKIGILYMQLGGIFAILFSTSIALFLFFLIFAVSTNTTSQPTNWLNDPRVTLICFGVWFLLIGWPVGFALINAYPNIWLAEDGLSISVFLFFKIFIPWSKIIDVRIGQVRFGHDLVRTTRITPFHIIFGWIYSRSLYPSFIIRRNIEDHDLLISNLAKRVQVVFPENL